MRVLGCDNDTLALELPACPAPTGAGSYKVTLSRSHCVTQTLVFALIAATPTTPAFINVVLPAPSLSLKRGVWVLSVTTPCGCYSTPVYLDRCRVPLLPGNNFPTRDTPTPVPVKCSPPLQPDLNAQNPVLGFVFARSSDGTFTGASLGPPAYGAQVPPFPPLTFFDINTDSDGLGLEGVLEAPGIAALAGASWQLLDVTGREIAAGELTSFEADTLVFEAALLDFLSCGLHYLAINTEE